MKKQPPSLLKKKITELTLADFEAMERPLGTSARPFPMWGIQRIEHDGQSDLEKVLSSIASDSSPMKVYSERSYEEVMALAYCDMPVPSMLPLFKDALERRGDPLERQRDILEGKQPQNENFNRTQMLIGDPGHGKSFMGALMGRLRSPSSVEIFDCGGKNMNDLLFEMVLDFGAGDALPKAIDKRLAAGALQQLSLGMLKELGESVEGAVSMDGAHIVSVDWEKIRHAGTEKVEFAYQQLTKISKIEGLDAAGGNALGMNSQYGALIRAYLENREIVLDEYNKSREGSDNALQTVIQFMIGEIRETTVENPLKNKDHTSGPSTFTFRRDDMGVGFFVTFTGNKTEDGITTRSLNRSVYDRLKPDTLPDPEVIDWQHRICQMMVGVPVSTLYTVFREQADKDPDAFGEWLMWLRQSKAKIEGAPVPELQETLLMNWKDVVQSAENLAKFYNKWAEISDANKIMSNGHSDLVEEVDEEYSKKEGMSFRRIKQHIEESIPIRSRMEPVDAPVVLDMKASWSKPPQLAERIEENPSLHFGTRLAEFIERMAYEKSSAIGKPKLYEKLLKAMDEFSLRDITLQEGARSQRKSIEECLNISAFSDRDMNKQAKMARKVFCDYIRQVDPQITAEDDHIVTVKRFHDALLHVAQEDTAADNTLYVANRDHETLSSEPLAHAVVKDAALYMEREFDFTMRDLVHHDDFIASLAMPTVTGKNLSAVWETNIRKLREEDEPGQASEAAAADGASAGRAAQNDNFLLSQNDALKVAENQSSYGIGATSLQVLYQDEAGEDKVVSVHIVRNSQRGKTLVVGEKVPSKLQAAFREAGITHVDRNDPNAKSKVEAAVNEMTRNMPVSIKDRLVEAFKYRNDTDIDRLKGKDLHIADLLVDDGIEMVIPKFVVKSKKGGVSL